MVQKNIEISTVVDSFITDSIFGVQKNIEISTVVDMAVL